MPHHSRVTGASPAERGAAGAVPATPKGVASRALILRVAAEVFAGRGYTGATMRDLIEASGMTKGAFYFYFSSKEALAWAVVEQKQQEWLGWVSQRVLASGDPASQLRGLAGAMLELHRSDPSFWSISKLTKELAQAPGAVSDARKPLRQWVEFVAGLIRATQAAGQARADVDAMDLAAVLVGGFDGLKGLYDVLEDGPEKPRFEAGVQVLARMLDAFLTP